MPTAAQKRYQAKVRALGCIVCRNRRLGETPAAIHHCETGGGGRKDEDKVLPLCYHHHQGKFGVHTLGRPVWQDQYGTEQELMDQVNKLLNTVL